MLLVFLLNEPGTVLMYLVWEVNSNHIPTTDSDSSGTKNMPSSFSRTFSTSSLLPEMLPVESHLEFPDEENYLQKSTCSTLYSSLLDENIFSMNVCE